MEKRLRRLKAIGNADVDEARRFLLGKVMELYVELDEAQAERFAAEVAKEGIPGTSPSRGRTGRRSSWTVDRPQPLAPGFQREAFPATMNRQTAIPASKQQN